MDLIQECITKLYMQSLFRFSHQTEPRKWIRGLDKLASLTRAQREEVFKYRSRVFPLARCQCLFFQTFSPIAILLFTIHTVLYILQCKQMHIHKQLIMLVPSVLWAHVIPFISGGSDGRRLLSYLTFSKHPTISKGSSVSLLKPNK